MSLNRLLLYFLLLLVLALVPPLLLGFLLHGEGPLWLPVLWSAVSLSLVLWLTNGPPLYKAHKPYKVIRFLTPLWISLGLLLILVLLNVSRRSLAEVWFLMVRQGRARGFFSYFVALVYGFLTTLSAMLVLYYGIIASLVALGVVSLLVWAILYSQNIGYAAALCLALVLFILMNKKKFALREPKQILVMTVSVFLPFSIIPLVMLPLLPLVETSDIELRLPGIDVTPLVLRVSPTLPLLLDVPGYGLDVGASRFSNRLDLSSVPLFEIEGPPGETFYLASATYSVRSSDGWVEAVYNSDASSTSRLMNGQANLESHMVLRLRFVGEYYDRFPLPAHIQDLAFLSPPISGAELPPVRIASLQSGVRFTSPIEGGTLLFLTLFEHRGDSPAGVELGIQEGDPKDYTDPGPDPQGRIAQLARQWKLVPDNPDSELNTGLAIEAYLKEQYGYSKILQGGPSSFALERFLFEEKRGYCLHFASAFVVLLRHLGIPARLVEGFRIGLNAQGRGLIRGTDAHAWAEAFIGGRWLRFDPTPSGTNLPTYQRPAGFAAGPGPGPNRSVSDSTAVHRSPGRPLQGWYFILFLIGVLTLFGALFRLYLHLDPQRYRKNRLRRLVRLARRHGIPGPEILGWLQWEQSVRSANFIKDPDELERLIRNHLEKTFGSS